MAQIRRLICPVCEHNAVIRTTRKMNHHLVYRYCACLNVECGLTYVIREEFERVLSPSAISFEHVKKGLKNALSKKQYQLIFDELSS